MQCGNFRIQRSVFTLIVIVGSCWLSSLGLVPTGRTLEFVNCSRTNSPVEILCSFPALRNVDDSRLQRTFPLADISIVDIVDLPLPTYYDVDWGLEILIISVRE